MWRFRAEYAPYLVPAAGLLAVSLLQADLMLTATTAGQALLDRIAAAATPGAVVPDGSPTGNVSGRAYAAIARGADATMLAVLMALFLLLAQGIVVWNEHLRSRITGRFQERMQGRMLDALSRELGATRSRRETAMMNQVFTVDAAALSSLLIFGIVGALESLARIGIYAYGIIVVPGGPTVLAVLVPMALVFQGGVTRLFLSREHAMVEASEGHIMQARSRTMQLFENLGRLIYFGSEREEGARLLDVTASAAGASRRYQLVSSVRATVSGIVTTLSLPLVVLAALTAGNVSAGSIVKIQTLIMLLTAAIASLTSLPSMLVRYGPSLRRLDDVLAVPEQQPEPAQLRQLRASSAPLSISMRGIAFRYPGATRDLLHDVSFEIPSGARVGIVGRSGSGKSTIARLLIGDLRPESGQIMLDDVDATAWHLRWRRELVAFLPAEQGFLRGTLEENVLFGRAKKTLPGYERALHASGVVAIAAERADEGGLHYQLFNPIEQLSSGQRRRVGIARLLAGDQPILVFDEPGAQLDPRGMREVARALATACAGRTSIIITHDPDVFATDFNLFVVDGRIDDVGPHDDLQRRNAGYADLLEQNVAEREERGLAGVPGLPPKLVPVTGPTGIPVLPG